MTLCVLMSVLPAVATAHKQHPGDRLGRRHEVSRARETVDDTTTGVIRYEDDAGGGGGWGSAVSRRRSSSGSFTSLSYSFQARISNGHRAASRFLHGKSKEMQPGQTKYTNFTTETPLGEMEKKAWYCHMLYLK